MSFIFLLPGVWLLRQNNLKMIELRDEVVRIDQETGNINKIEPALLELRAFVLTHMNANMSTPVELVGSFNTAVEKARKEAEESASVNGSIYRKAQKNCEDRNIPLTARAQCIQDYVLTNSDPTNPVAELKIPPKEQFVYIYSSPVLSTDPAGITIVISAVSAGIALLMLLTQVVAPRVLAAIESDPLE